MAEFDNSQRKVNHRQGQAVANAALRAGQAMLDWLNDAIEQVESKNLFL
jgi:hypothetical protein